jgi:hypothetical protein
MTRYSKLDTVEFLRLDNRFLMVRFRKIGPNLTVYIFESMGFIP